MYVCLCKSIRDAEFQDIVTRHARSPEAISYAMGLDESCCGKCAAQIDDRINDVIRMRMQ
ncbi:MAG: (2Fe-2S)-binding protein [Nitrospira defluvii]|nr:(2Fe-2S)-binding protein [Nitrospira defluvii]